MNATHDGRDPVDVLAEEFADRLRRGERPSIGDYAAAHPDHADKIRDIFPAVAQMEQLNQFRKSGPYSPHGPHHPERLGDFRIVRELGRGGMGVVFEAVQESLGRRVALKILASQSQLDPERRARFVREAKAAASLHHTNIVPVFGVGEQDGFPYYVMQIIEGHGLNALITRWKSTDQRETRFENLAETTIGAPGEGPLAPAAPHEGHSGESSEPLGDWRFIAGLGMQAAQALDYAHQKGVLHRDVKPANLLLDKRGEVWVVDFGLAKIASEQGLTATGHFVGTLQYMAPECLRGDSGEPSDVYGLGATLYELLTLAPPFDGSSPVEIMKRIADTEPLPPRRINPAIPLDLETIVLKAMAREPARRYASARMLAEDLQAFMEDRPIQARRLSRLERTGRWVRRHPIETALSTCTAAAIVLALIVGWVGYVKTKKALGDRENALAAEANRRGEAERASANLRVNLLMSLEAFEKVFQAAAGDENRPRFGPRGPMPPPPPPNSPMAGEAADRAAVLEAVLAFYDQFAKENQTDARLQFEAAKAYRRVGEMHQMLGRQDRAAAAYSRAFQLFDSVKSQRGEDSEYRFELMLAYSSAPVIEGTVEEQLLRAAELGRGFTEGSRRWLVGGVYLKLGWAREQARNREGAIQAYQKAIDLYAAEPGESPRPFPVLLEQTTARQRQAVLLVEANQNQEARRILEKAASELRPAITGGPHGRFGRDSLAAIYSQLADVCARLRDEQKAAFFRFEAQLWREGPGGRKGPGGPGRPGRAKGPNGPNKRPPPKIDSDRP